MISMTCGANPGYIKIRFNPNLYNSRKPLLEFQEKYGIKVESFGGLAPIRNQTGGPLDALLKNTSDALSKRYGAQVTEGQVLLKWLQAKNVIIITYVALNVFIPFFYLILSLEPPIKNSDYRNTWMLSISRLLPRQK